MNKTFTLMLLLINSYAFSATIPIAPNTLITEGTTKGSEKIYSININKNEGVALTLAPNLNSGYIQLNIYDNEQLKGYLKSTNATSTLTTQDFTAAATGTYYLQLISTGAGSYKLGVYNAWFNTGTTDADRPFHGSANTAWDLKNGTYESKTSETNWYHFVANAGSKIQIDITPYLNSGGFNATIYEEMLTSSGSRNSLSSITSNCCSQSNNVTKTITYIPAVSGNYYLAIRQDSGGTITLNATGIDVGSYQTPTSTVPTTTKCPTMPAQKLTTYSSGILKIPEVQITNGLTNEILKYAVELEWIPLAEPMMFKIKSATPN